jgi:hypothetical protein
MRLQPGKRKLYLILAAACICSVAWAGFHSATGHRFIIPSPAAAEPQSGDPAGRQGYLLNLEVLDSGTRLLSAAEIDNYMENKHLLAEDDWLLLLLNEAGEGIGSKRIGNPGRFSPILFPEQRLPFTIKVPRMAGLAAVVIYNQHREEQLRIPVDSPFRTKAAANRRDFLAHDRENRRMLLDEARMGRQEGSVATRQPQPASRFASLPEELQKRVVGEIALEMEQLEQFGAEIMNLHRSLNVEPEHLARWMEEDRLIAAAAAAPDIRRAAGAYMLTGQVTDLDSGAPVVGADLEFRMYDSYGKYQYLIGHSTTDVSGYYSMAVDAGIVRIMPDYSTVVGSKYVAVSQTVAVSGNTTWNFKAIPGVSLWGMVTNEQDQGVANVNIQAYAKDLQLTFSAYSIGIGPGIARYSMIVPRSRPLRISVSVSRPYIAPPTELNVILTEDTTRNYRLATGWIVTITVVGNGGTALANANVLLRQLAATTTGTPSWSGRTDAYGRISFAIAKDTEPRDFILCAYATNYVLQSAGLEITQDLEYKMQLAPGNMLSGIVRDNLEAAVRGVRVRAYQGGTFVGSALTATDGSYALPLPPGTYELEALPPSGSTLAPTVIKNVPVNEPRTLNLIMDVASGILTVKLYFPSETTYNRFSSKNYVRFELYQSGLTVHAGSGVLGTGGFDVAQGKYFRPYSLYVKNGTYKLAAFLIGCRPISLPDAIEVSGQSSASIVVPEPLLWTGVLRGADNTPLAGMTVLSYNDLTTYYDYVTTNSAGSFSVLLTPNGFVKFYTNPASRNILRTVRPGDITAGRNDDVVLDEFPSFADSGQPLTQIYGNPDRFSRWNIVMISDGYTGVTESYTDVNGNGRWDGVLYYDINKDGVWNTGEPYQRYGTTSAPVSGTTPTLSNEPFTDLNGDGVPNLQDQALYDQNTLDTARSLFGQDEWQRHREAFNIFRIRLISNQAGHKILDEAGNVVIQRDTALGTYLSTPSRGYLFSANYTLISQYINQYVPECDTRIVMVNQPIRMGRVNSYMFQYGGDVPSLCNDYVVAHEMGHNVGLLADEYMEYQETYKGMESAARNVTSLIDWRHIPWKYLISPGKEIPSIPGSGGVGLFEGAGYYTGGRYRPTEHCMMVSGNRYCPVCTAEIEIRLRDITGVVPEAHLSAPMANVGCLYPEFRWEPLTGVSHYLLEIETADGTQLVASYDIYDTTFVLPFALTGNTEYRWRLRPASPGRFGAWSAWVNFRPLNAEPVFTGVFPQIAAGGYYQTILTNINTGLAPADVMVSLKWHGSPAGAPANGSPDLHHFLIRPMGVASFPITLAGDVTVGYAQLFASLSIDGTALFQAWEDSVILSEAAIGLSKPTRRFTVYIDNTNSAKSGYAVANTGSSAATLNLTLRDRNGVIKDQAPLALPAGQHISEFAYQRFPSTAADGFEGSLEFISDQNVAAVALRYDNLNLEGIPPVFSTIPVSVDEAATTLYFPQVADGNGYRTNLILMNPQETGTTARFEFYRSDGTPLIVSINGTPRSSHDLPLPARGVAHFFTDENSADLNVGWVKATSPVAILGSSIFQTRAGNRILSEAGVASSLLTRHFTAYVESLNSTESGLAMCNPNDTAVTLTLNLRRSTGETVASTNVSLPPRGHTARFFAQWFPHGFAEFEGTLEVMATAPVSAVALRYDNPQLNVFATLPVVILP